MLAQKHSLHSNFFYCCASFNRSEKRQRLLGWSHSVSPLSFFFPQTWHLWQSWGAFSFASAAEILSKVSEAHMPGLQSDLSTSGWLLAFKECQRGGRLQSVKRSGIPPFCCDVCYLVWFNVYVEIFHSPFIKSYQSPIQQSRKAGQMILSGLSKAPGNVTFISQK